jgi:hypothetical protein
MNDNTSSSPTPARCPYCDATVSEKRIEKHKALRCPKAPAEVVASRPPQPKRKISQPKRKISQPKRKISQPPPLSGTQLKDYEYGLQKTAYARFVRAQRDSMSD